MAAFPLLLLAMFVVMVILPQRRRMRQHQALIASATEGSRILTVSGIYGVVVAVRGDTLVLSVAPGVTMHVARRAIARLVALDEGDAPSATELGVASADSARRGGYRARTEADEFDPSGSDPSGSDPSNSDPSNSDPSNNEEP